MVHAVADTFHALGDPVRTRIVDHLAITDATVGELVALFPISFQAVSQHLGVLERAGIVSRHREGRTRRVRLETEPLDAAFGWMEARRMRLEERYQRLDDVLAEARRGHGAQPRTRAGHTGNTRSRGAATDADNQQGAIMTQHEIHHPGATEHTRVSEQSLRHRREFAHPAAAVQAAHTDPALFTRWMGPRGTTVRLDRFEAATGGAFRYVVEAPDGGAWAFHGSYHDVSDGRIVHTWEYEGETGHHLGDTGLR